MSAAVLNNSTLRCSTLLFLIAIPLSCAPSGKEVKAPPATTRAPASPGATFTQDIVLSLIGTSDLHGHVEPTMLQVKDKSGAKTQVARGGLPLLAGYVANVRRRHPVVLLDAGDLFQGTLVSNLGEGKVVIEAYNVMRYTAAAIGNHEFDYGPVGPRGVARQGTDEDPVGALKARIAEAQFPFLAANIIDQATSAPIAWPNVFPSRILHIPELPDLAIGVIGATAEDTPRTTNAANLRGLTIEKVVPAVQKQAQALRQQGAQLILLTVHEGANCKGFGDPRDLTPCKNEDGRIVTMAEQLGGQVDAIVAGHSHAGMAHFVGPVPVIQAYSGGRVFGRIDLVLHREAGRLVFDPSRTRIFPPQEVCQVNLPARPQVEARSVPVAEAGPQKNGTAMAVGAEPLSARCDARVLDGTELTPAVYEERPVLPVTEVVQALQPHSERAQAQRKEPLGFTSREKLSRRYRGESALGMLLADLIREGAELALKQKVDFAFQNGGGIRSDLPAGPLTYGDFFEVVPFDNRLAVLKMPGEAVLQLITLNLQTAAGALVPSGLTVSARCQDGKLHVALRDAADKPISLKKTYSVAVSDFLASGGDNFGAILPRLPKGAVTLYDDVPPLREIMLSALRRHKELPVPPPDHSRLHLPMQRPVHCDAPPPSATSPSGE